MRRLRLAALAAAVLAGAAAPAPQTIRIVSTPIPLDPSNPGQTRLGALDYVWGARLGARGTSRFGGLSGLEVERAGSQLAFTVVTDDGDVVRWTGSRERPPFGRATLRPLLGVDGRIPAVKRLRDAEDIAQDGDGFLVSYEGRNRIERYAGFGRAAEPSPAPVASFSENLGFEALTVLPGPDGGTVAVGAENGRVWLCPRAVQTCRLVLGGPPEFGYWLTALDHLPGTRDMVAVYRFYNPFRKSFAAIVAWLPVRDGRVRIVPLARITAPLNVANFEGIAAERAGDGYRLYLVSDNGFEADSPTLLMAFDWAPDAKRPASPPASSGSR